MTAADKIAEAMVTQSELDAGGVVGVIRTSRHDAVRYNAGWECGDVFGRDSDYDGPTLTLEVADAADAQAMLDAIANMPALAYLADALARECQEWRQEYRAVQSMNDLLRAANAKMIAERDAQAQAQENAKLRGIIAKIDAYSPRADKTCEEPGITLSEAVQRRWPELRIGETP